MKSLPADKNYLIELTQNLYRLTLLFPKKEPLRYKMRELANDILAKPNKECLETILGYFEVAKSQNWVSPSDILNIQEEYSKLSTESRQRRDESGNEQDNRQEKIIQFLRDRGKAQAWELKQVFPQVSKRTIRRDFEAMLKQGLVERIGEKNDTYYQVRVV